MMDASYNYRQNDGITRLPVEIWREILLFATALPSPWDSLRDIICDPNPKPGDDIFGWYERASDVARRQAWWSVWQNKVAVVLTCRTWRDIGEAMLYENIRYILKPSALENVQDLPASAPESPSPSHIDSEPLIQLTKAHLVRRMDLSEERPHPKLFSLASHCVNLNELRFVAGYIPEPDGWHQLYQTLSSLSNLKVLIIHTVGNFDTLPEASPKVILPSLEVLGLHAFRAIAVLAHWELPSLKSLSFTSFDVEHIEVILELHGARLFSLSLVFMICPRSHPLPLHTLCPLLTFFGCLHCYDVHTFPILLSEHPTLQTLGVFSLHSLAAKTDGPADGSVGLESEGDTTHTLRGELPLELQNFTRSQFPCLRAIKTFRNVFYPKPHNEFAKIKSLDASVREHCRNEGLSIQNVLGEELV
ncbi:hypothetical protein SISNIDRAFT_460788 [Sistotremastrum niveocremeum HHB9708]|uniref:F-box domain-containing protein n=1 Tax=Sistotremastrum niveocremeum HHB9708 TaxID=1314777 RepID=A0A164N9X8_9AGAM|nr:hypothetical protein SISNIDRAFT_460788 [Sistotremastrum niveocremeum HHB9708]